MTKYVLFMPQGGFNDCLCGLIGAIKFSKIHNRVLLLNMYNSTYQINFSNYFGLNYPNIIYDFNKIKSICDSNKNSVYPHYLKYKLNNIFNNKIPLVHIGSSKPHPENFALPYYINNKQILPYCVKSLISPKDRVNNKIILYVKSGGGNGYSVFKDFLIKPNIKNYCKKYRSLLGPKYLCIHIRHTDFKCDYKKLYYDNKKIIDSYEKIYIATDNIEVLKWFKTLGLNIYNFCKFPSDTKQKNLHSSNMNPDDKIKSLMCDLYIAAMSDKIISNSRGCFINLLRKCHQNKKHIYHKFR